jgi:GNAT superfamily N-acetyltransferase
VNRIARELASAAVEDEPPFLIRKIDVVERMIEADNIIIVQTETGATAAFGAFHEPEIISPKSGLVTVYVGGVLVDPRRKRRGICRHLLAFAAENADVVIGFSQNPRILAAFRSMFFTWPSEDNAPLKPEFAADLQGYLRSIGRASSFDTASGVVTHLYEHDLYRANANFHPLGTSGDGLLLLGFTSSTAYAAAVDQGVKEATR